MKRTLVDCLPSELAQGVLRDCLEDGNVIQSRHFRDELRQEDLSFEDAWHVMRSGRIVDAGENDIKSGEWKYKVEGYEPGDKWLVIVFSFKQINTVLLITVYSVESRRRCT